MYTRRKLSWEPNRAQTENHEWERTVDEESSGQQRQSPVPGAHDRHTGAESPEKRTNSARRAAERTRGDDATRRFQSTRASTNPEDWSKTS